MTINGYRKAVAAELRLYAQRYLPKGKRRRDWKHKAFDLGTCGRTVQVLQCSGCNGYSAESAAIEGSCNLRICPTCARRRADLFRQKLMTRWETRPRPRKSSLYLLTFTLQYDPCSSDDLSIEGIAARKNTVLDGVRYAWRQYLKPRGQALATALEVSPRGAVHAHALYLGRRPDVDRLRDVYMVRAGLSPFVNVKAVANPRKGIREVAKYLAKAASPRRIAMLRGALGEFTDPRLAVRVEVALAGCRLLQCYGSWRGTDDEQDVPLPAPEHCAHCGQVGAWLRTQLAVETWLSLAPTNWLPRFTRAGPPAKRGLVLATAA